MSKYKQSTDTTTAESWNRASHIILWNEDIPRVECHHETRTQYSDGKTVNEYLGQLSHVMTDETLEIPLVDPDTLEPTATTFTAGDYALRSTSVYLFLARQRDGAS